jgi:apolipoprotein N-acyltransferase
MLYALCFPPFSFSFLAWVALAPLFVAISSVRPRRAAGYGLLWGVVMAHGVGWWFATLAGNYFGVSPLAGAVARFGVSVLLFGIYFSAFAAWLSWLVRRQAVNPFLVAAGWGVCEFARANLLFGNPFVLFGYSQVSHPRLMQIADITGPYGVGMLLALVNACLVGSFSRSLLGRRPALAMLGTIIIGCATLGYGEWRLSQTLTTGDSMTIAVVQGAIEPQLRWDPQYSEANLTRYLELTRTTTSARPALIFWPEYAVSFPLQRELSQRETLFSSMQEFGAELVTGGPYYRFGVKDIHNRNSVFLVRDGKLVDRYDKLRLVPFAEDDRRSWFGVPRQLPYEPGSRPQLLQARAARLGVFLCFEAMYPDLVRGFVVQGAEVLVNPSNDDWFSDPAPARHMLDIASVRAIEQRRYLVRPTVTGFSAVIDPHGRAAALSGFGEPAVLMAEIRPSSIPTVYGRWGDIVAWLITVTVMGVSIVYVKWLNWYTWSA